MLISVIVPVYNVEKYLEQCVNSIINQSYKDIEIILVNDGSTDNSGNICNELAQKDNRIIVIHKENGGLGLARNSGLDVAKGEYVTFVDSDDYIETNSIEDMYNMVVEEKIDTCIGGFIRVLDDTTVVGRKQYESKIYENEKVLTELLPKLIGSSTKEKDAIRMSVWNAMYSMKIIKDNNLRFPSERQYISEDIIFDLDYYKYAKRVAISDNCNYNYRVNVESLTKSYNPKRFELTKALYQKELEKIKELNIFEQADYRLKRQLFIYIKACIKQENIKKSKLTYTQALKNIKNICEDEMVQNAINNYPVKDLGIKQKVFVYMLKYKLAFILYLFICR